MSGPSKLTPITERSNDLTRNIDLATPSGIVRLLRQVDAQIFTGWDTHEGLYDNRCTSTLMKISECVYEALSEGSTLPSEGHTHSSEGHTHREGAVVLSGCGTSGRIAFITAQSLNSLLPSSSILYTIAGGDQALLKSVEATEDSWRAGVQALTEATRGRKRVVFIGITCGFSAPFVAGQLDYCLEHSAVYTPVLLGFNTVEQARRTEVAGWDKTFHDVAMEMQRRSEEGHKCFILNPVVGPEAITGSTRMKSGTATKILLEVILILAYRRLQGMALSPVTHTLQSYELTYRHTYFQLPAIATLMQSAGKCLCACGHVYYLGEGSLGIMAVIDGTECPPTFGAAFNDVRGFVRGGYAILRNSQGDLSDLGPDYQLSWEDFTRSHLPLLTPSDLIIIILRLSDSTPDQTQLSDMISPLRERGCAVACVAVGTTDAQGKMDYAIFDSHIEVLLPSQLPSHYLTPHSDHTATPDCHMAPHSDHMTAPDCHVTLLYEAAVKWVLNAISTGAHVLRGKVLGNRMIDLQVSNSKLFHRAVDIIRDFSGQDRDSALNCLLRSIYGTDVLGAGLMEDISHHIEIATGRSKVVPVALLLSTGLYSIASSRAALDANPIVRNVLIQQVHSSSDI